MRNNKIFRPAGAVLGLLFFIAIALPQTASGAPGGLLGGVGGIVGGVGGVVGGVTGSGGGVGGALGVGGAVGGTLGAISGPGGSIAGGIAGIAGASSSNILGLGGITSGVGASSGLSAGFAALRGPSGQNAVLNAQLSLAYGLMQRQQLVGQVVSVGSQVVNLKFADGTLHSLAISADIAVALRGLVGKNVIVRTLDGRNVASLVGRSETVRGTITAIDQNLIGFVTPTGLTYVAALTARDAAGLRVGAHVVALSQDFGKSLHLWTMGFATPSSLADTYVGNVLDSHNGIVSLRIGSDAQAFAVDAVTARLLASLRGHVVAVQAPDGLHVNGLMAQSTLAHLLGVAQRPLSASATVVAIPLAVAGALIRLQLPNGDVQSLRGPASALQLRAGVPISIQYLDKLHVRVLAGARVANFVDARACATVNSGCGSSSAGRVISVAPAAVAVLFGNGDVRTFLGNVTPLGARVGVPIRISQLDALHARVVAGARVANLVQAGACVTINAGCAPATGSFVGNGNGTTIIQMPDGTKQTLLGVLAGVAVNTPVLLQPLDSTHVVALAGVHVAGLAFVGACATVNASCPKRSANGNIPGGGSTVVGVGACVTVNAPGCSTGGGNSGGGNPGGGTPIVGVGACVTVGGPGCPTNGGNPGGGTPIVGAGACVTVGAPGCPTGGGNPGGGTPIVGAGACVTVGGPGCPTGGGNPGGGTPVVGVGACVTVGAPGCPTNGGTAPQPGGGNPGGGVGVGVGVCVSVGAPCPTNGGTAPQPGGGNPGGPVVGVGACVTIGAAGCPTNGGTAPQPGGGNPGGGTVGVTPVGPGTGGLGGSSINSAIVNGTPQTVTTLAFAPAGACGDSGQIIVRVNNSTTGAPISGATVDVAGRYSTEIATKADGQVIFLRMPVGSYHALIRRQGYMHVQTLGFYVGCTAAAMLNVKLGTSRSWATLWQSTLLTKTSARQAMAHSMVCVHGAKRATCTKP
jgi:hypothetical protein